MLLMRQYLSSVYEIPVLKKDHTRILADLTVMVDRSYFSTSSYTHRYQFTNSET